MNGLTPPNAPRNARIMRLHATFVRRVPGGKRRRMTLRAIADQLAKEGYRGPNGEPVTRQAVGKIVQREKAKANSPMSMASSE